MDIILIPGLWLDGSSWDQVVPTLEQAGHRTHALTLPGMESKEADRSRITLRDHVEAVVEAVDACGSDGQVVLVGHSAGCGIAHAAVDARPDRVARAVYVGGFPTGDGDAIADGFPVQNGEVPLPDWSAFEEGDLVDLDDEARAEFRERAIPSPEHVTSDPQRLSDERRYDVPVTVIATEFTSEMLRGGSRRGSRRCGSSQGSARSSTSTCPPATGRSSPGRRSSRGPSSGHHPQEPRRQEAGHDHDQAEARVADVATAMGRD